MTTGDFPNRDGMIWSDAHGWVPARWGPLPAVENALAIPPDWTPTAENVNALPDPLRLYIHELETVCDPAGDVRKLHLLKKENEILCWECERLSRSVKRQQGTI